MINFNKVDVVLPVFNEADILEHQILELTRYLSKQNEYDWRVIIADNASTDGTPEIASRLAAQNNRIVYSRLGLKGRGYALRQMFFGSSSDIVVYMDVDLSTNLRYLDMLIHGIACGYDAAVGSRLMHASRTKRRLFRDIISRSYNLLIRMLFFNGFSDAQCGFKAFRTDVIKQYLPYVENNNWFFDTEVLLLFERNKKRIFEVPVEWIEGLNSKVNIADAVRENILGLIRMRSKLHKMIVGK